MKAISKHLILMLGFVAATCFTACTSHDYDSDFVEEQDSEKKDSGKQDSKEPEYVKVTEVTLDKYEINMSRNSTDTITATVYPKNASNKEVKWASSDSTIVKVKDGKITSNPNNESLEGYGTVKITATSVDQGIKAECIVTVEQFSGVTYPAYPDKQQW